MGKADKILVTGALGQLGTDLVPALQANYGERSVICTDIHPPQSNQPVGPFHIVDVMNPKTLSEIVDKYEITQIYHLAAILSARAEKQPELAWKVNMEGLMNVLRVAREKKIKKIYWPSSIGVFGADTPKVHTPQFTIMNPGTVYGISKLSGERWCSYYNKTSNLDIRSLRYPGLIGSNSLPGGGTTDYAVDLFFRAVENEKYTCFLEENTRLPMMYMDDAVRATIELMEADRDRLRITASYNVAAISFTPGELAEELRKYVPSLDIEYVPDYRQAIADSWPQSIDDTYAREDWHWKHNFDLPAMTKEILNSIRKKKPVSV